MSSANSFGSRFILTTFGESHGTAMGAVIEGCPAGVPFDTTFLSQQLARRRPGHHGSAPSVFSDRQEVDQPEILSGVFADKTLGTPIAIIVRNQDQRPEDYAKIAESPRRGHADDVWRAKFGHTDPRGGGRASGRETLTRVIGGAIAKMFLQASVPQLHILGFTSQIGPIELSPDDRKLLEDQKNIGFIDQFSTRLPSPTQNAQAVELLLAAKREGKSYGGTAELWIDGVPPSLGQPVFHKLKADLTAAFMSVGATTAIEIGDGWEATTHEGSQWHGSGADEIYGGIRGGISTGERIKIRVGFKPTSTVLDFAKAGRHDPCIIPRAIPVLEAMAALVLADHVLWAKTDQYL